MLVTKYKNQTLSNLTPLQINALNPLKHNKNVVIKATDKNLGPAIMDLEQYTEQVLSEHLLTNAYTQLTCDEATHNINRIKRDLKQIISNHHGSLSKAEITYLKRSFQQHHRLPIFYGLPKVHKNPIALHPVVSTTNSFLAVFSIWLDYRMKELLPLIKSYVKNSTLIINKLKHMLIPDGAQVFTADAKSMYTNIDTTIGIQSVRGFLDTNKEKLSPDFPSYLFLEVLEAVMQNNMFSFGDTFWLQLTGTAMGTPVACAYDTVTYGNYDNNLLLPKFQENLLYYRCYIDNVLGIWLLPPNNAHTAWEDFKVQLNNWGSLEWQIEEPSNKTTFLDLN